MIRPATGASLLAALVLSLLLATTAAAQIDPPLPTLPDEDEMEEAAAHLALSTTPVGALAPLASIPGLAGTTGRMQIHGQFGLLDEEGGFSTRNFALALSIPSQSAVIRLTGGIADFACDEDGLFAPGDGFELDCGLGFFAGVDATVPLVRPVLAGPSATSFTANLVLSLGMSSNDLTEITFRDPFDPTVRGSVDVGASALSLSVGVPLAFVVQSDDVTVIPHITPRIGYGRAETTVRLDFMGERDRESMTDSDALPMVGAGVDILFGRSGVGLGVGVQKIFAEDSDMLIGINLTFRRR